jgi:hypothetical protein
VKTFEAEGTRIASAILLSTLRNKEWVV